MRMLKCFANNCPPRSGSNCQLSVYLCVVHLQAFVLFICFAISLCICVSKTESYGLSMICFEMKRHCGLSRNFKTDPTVTVALCFGYAKTPLCCSSARQSHAFDEGLVAWRVISKQILLRP
jgi:hypothetical protein